MFPQTDATRRRADGSLDIDFYARRAGTLRREARDATLLRLVLRFGRLLRRA